LLRRVRAALVRRRAGGLLGGGDVAARGGRIAGGGVRGGGVGGAGRIGGRVGGGGLVLLPGRLHGQHPIGPAPTAQSGAPILRGGRGVVKLWTRVGRRDRETSARLWRGSGGVPAGVAPR